MIRQGRGVRAILSLGLLAFVLGGVLGLGGCASEGDAADDAASAKMRAARAGTPARPDQLVGLDADRVTQLIGRADFKRSDGAVDVWQYRNDACVIDVYLYRNVTGSYRVEQVETRGRDLQQTADPHCVATLLHDRYQASAVTG